MVSMTWEEALPIAIARTGHERFRFLCSDDNPDIESRDGHRTLMLQLAGGPQYPQLAKQAANLRRALFDWAVSGFSMTDEAEQARRLSICRACEWFDPGPTRCRHMGCGCWLEKKVRLKTEHCPLPKPKW